MNEVIQCQQCARLVDHLQQVKRQYPHYYCKPVPALGAAKTRLLIVGLAPGKHGANATGFPFTGDAAGTLLYQTMFDAGFCSHPQPLPAGQSFRLVNCRITNAVKCLPPQNKPLMQEINRCNAFLRAEIRALESQAVILALGQIAHKAILKSLNLKQVALPFAHGAQYSISHSLKLIDSYHCSRYNTQTGRLTEAMFRAIFGHIRLLLEQDD